MDTSDPDIRFNSEGICNHCTAALHRIEKQIGASEDLEHKLLSLTQQIKREGENKEFDCIIGMSGGVDSTTVAYLVKQLGLRPLAIHLDNGWNTEISVDNIHNTLEVLDIELYTHVIEWDEFKDIQLSFLKASVPNCEIPTDHGIAALLFNAAANNGTRFILSGSNLSSESIMPLAWGHYHQDLKHLKAVYKTFYHKTIKTLPTISLLQYLNFVFRKGIRQIPFLNYINYDRNKYKAVLSKELGWRDYGSKHHESIWTRFFQGYYLPVKFGYDKRRAHLSSLICSGGMTRDEALEKMLEPTYPEALMKEDRLFVVKKFGLSENEFDSIVNAKPCAHSEYPGHYFLLGRMVRLKNLFRRVATSP